MNKIAIIKQTFNLLNKPDAHLILLNLPKSTDAKKQAFTSITERKNQNF